MNIITEDSLADIEFQIQWKSDEAGHEERFFTRINLWRDILPPGMHEQLIGKLPGVQIEAAFTGKDKLLPPAPSNRITVKRGRFKADHVEPKYGRFYPLGLLDGLANVFPGNIKPFRVIGLDNGSITADLNHPLSGYDLTLSAVVHDSLIKPYDRGGECSMLMECLADGPGMQVRGNGRPTDFLSEDALRS